MARQAKDNLKKLITFKIKSASNVPDLYKEEKNPRCVLATENKEKRLL